MLWEQATDQKLRCNLCAHRCLIGEGKRGVCRVRENRGGTLYTLVYGRTIAQHLDPIEKKPLFHFHPGSASFSIATAGCNFRCKFCQNWAISQMPREEDLIGGQPASPAALVATARRLKAQSIAYTYTEPTVFAEYAVDIASLAHESGIANVFVTNGYMTPELLDVLGPQKPGGPPLLDAANVDLKAGRGEFYRELCGARLEPVLDNLVRMRNLGIWLEVTTLIIPGLNDSEDELRWVADFLVREVGEDVPWHVSRFHPQYKMRDYPATPVGTLARAWRIGREAGLRYVYVGNVPGKASEDTTCHHCGETLISRVGYRIVRYHVSDGCCAQCESPVAGVGM
jgi:pyruvate formate lyase activating enzyme